MSDENSTKAFTNYKSNLIIIMVKLNTCNKKISYRNKNGQYILPGAAAPKIRVLL